MAYEKVFCVFCGSDAVVKNGRSSVGIQRYSDSLFVTNRLR